MAQLLTGHVSGEAVHLLWTTHRCTVDVRPEHGDVNRRRLLQRLLGGSLNVSFSDLVNLAEGFGFRLARVHGSHHIYRHSNTGSMLNLQEVRGQAKPYQVRQLLKLVEEHDLRLEDEP